MSKGADERILVRTGGRRYGKTEVGRALEKWLQENGAELVARTAGEGCAITVYRYLGETVRFVRRA